MPPISWVVSIDTSCVYAGVMDHTLQVWICESDQEDRGKTTSVGRKAISPTVLSPSDFYTACVCVGGILGKYLDQYPKREVPIEG